MGSVNNISIASVNGFLAEANLNTISILVKNQIAGNENEINQNLAQIIKGFRSSSFLKNASLQPPLGEFGNLKPPESFQTTDLVQLNGYLSELNSLRSEQIDNSDALMKITKGLNLVKSFRDDKNLFTRITRRVNLEAGGKYY